MEPNSLKWVGSSCGLHGPYIFYKAFKFHRNVKPRILSLGDFFFVRCKPEDPICIAELQLLWEERTTKQLLSSSKLYFLPEDTPQGRTVTHGEHEVIAVSEKVVVRLEDLVKWTVPDYAGWLYGLQAQPLKPSVLRELGTNGRREALHRYRESTLTSGLNFRDIQRERAQLGQEEDGRRVLVLSYPQYCRYRSVLTRLRQQPSALLTDHTVLALGGIATLHGNTRILYCRDTFEHSVLLANESVCDEFAPNLKGRPRKKKLSVSQRRDSQSQSQGQAQGQGSLGSQIPQVPSSPESKTPTKVRPNCKASVPNGKMTVSKPKSLCKRASLEEKEKVKDKEKEEKNEEMKEEEEKKEDELSEESRAEEQTFLVALYKYMKERDTPIERIPFLGFKQINLWTMFQAAQKLGGYELITVRRQWKNIYDELGGNPSSTSAATCTRRHYERLLLPYERHTKGENDKPLPSGKPKKQDLGSQEGGAKPKPTGGKKLKGTCSGKQGTKKGKEEQDTCPEHLTSMDMKLEIQEPCTIVKSDTSAGAQPIVVEEEDELQLTLKKEETSDPQAPKLVIPETLDCRDPHPPEWSLTHVPILLDKPKFSTDQHHPQLDAPIVTKSPYHPWENNKPAVHMPKPELGLLGPVVAREPGMETHGGRVGKVLPMCKQPQPPVIEKDSVTDKQDYGSRTEPNHGHTQTAAYCKAGQGVMSPLAKKKLLSQVCETNPYSFTPPLPPPLAPLLSPSLSASSVGERDGVEMCSEEGLGHRHGSLSDLSGGREVAPIFRPSVIQHAQSTKPLQGGGPPERSPLGELSETYTCRVGHPHLQPRVNPPWHPYLHRTQAQDGVENAGEKLLHVPPSQSQHSYGGDCYSSPHLHSLYRQTENCLSQERMVGYSNGEKRGHYIRDCDSSEAFVCSSLDRGGLSYRPPHYTDRIHGDSRSLEDEPRDFSISKPVSQRLSYPKPSFCVPYPMMHHGLDSHAKACRVPPMTVPKHSSPETPQPFFTSKPSPESVVGPVRPIKRSLGEPDDEGIPDRKVRVVTPMHPASSMRRGDPQCGEELKAADPAHAVHLSHGGHLPDVHPANTYSPHHSVSLYPGMYPGTMVPTRQEAGLQQHHLQYLKSQTAISPLVPPLAFHPMMLHRQLMATGPSPHHFYRHPGGAALYGDMLHHLYPLSTLTPPQLSSVHPSTRL